MDTKKLLAWPRGLLYRSGPIYASETGWVSCLTGWGVCLGTGGGEMAKELICPACGANNPSAATNAGGIFWGLSVVYCVSCGVVYVPLPKKE